MLVSVSGAWLMWGKTAEKEDYNDARLTLENVRLEMGPEDLFTVVCGTANRVQCFVAPEAMTAFFVTHPRSSEVPRDHPAALEGGPEGEELGGDYGGHLRMQECVVDGMGKCQRVVDIRVGFHFDGKNGLFR